ncbi:MAG: DUF177 domain-containing protein [Planctomycetota bacterium]|nr:MAG: DUF177 domain-containing protein [Planctomycetota bacterium]
MKIHIQELKKSPVYIDTFRPAHIIHHPDLPFTLQEDVYLAMVIRKDKENILAKGNMQATMILECSRCLENYSLPVQMDIEIRFLSRKNLVGKALMDLADSDLNVAYYDNETIDIDDHIRENLILATPLKPLCVQECKGLCHHCGANLNISECQCPKEKALDPRMALLKKMLEE